jgi:23S rRNA pseudouridine1911/1915/1917 synthase
MPSSTDRIRISARAAADHAGMRFDQAAALLFPDFSRARLQKWIRAGALTIDGQAFKPTHRLAGNEWLLLDAEPDVQGDVVAQDIPLEIIHADPDLLVVDKPAGMVVHPAAGNPDGTLQNALLHFDERLQEIPRSGIVHRLDKDTSGIMVVARSLRAHASLVKQLQTRSMSRIYEAVAFGDVGSGGTVDAPIGRHPRDRKRMAVVPSGKPAVSHYRVLERFGAISHIEVSLESGRTHQIRVHMAHIGHPLVGDAVYGRPVRKMEHLTETALAAVRAFQRQALHARELKLVHPATGRPARYEALLPADLSDLLAALRQAAE